MDDNLVLKESVHSENQEASCIWQRMIEIEVERIKLQDDPLCLLSPSEQLRQSGPSQYYDRLIEYTKQIGHIDKPSCLSALHDFINDLASGNVEYKSTKKAKRYREEGNTLFKLNNFGAAADRYRRGLLFAPDAFPKLTDQIFPKSSQEAALLHGNLSAVFFHQSLWVECAWSACLSLQIHLSIADNTPPQYLCKRLVTRVIHACKMLGTTEFNALDSSQLMLSIQKCLLWLRNQKNPNRVKYTDSDWDNISRGSVIVPEPQYGRKSDLYALSNGLSVLSSKERGRYIVTNRKFSRGDVLASEPAGGWIFSTSHEEYSVDEQATVACILLPFKRHSRCTACHNPIVSPGFVCPFCVDAAFCGPPTSCYGKHKLPNGGFSVPEWHKQECRYMFLLNSIGLGHLCFRLALLRINEILPYIRTLESDISIVTIDNLVDNFDKLPSPFEYALTGWLLEILLRSCLPSIDCSGLECFGSKSVGEWCFDMLRRLQCNAHAVTEVDISPNCRQLSSESFAQERIGGSLYPHVSLINHACEPNISYQFLNGFLIIRCIKDLSIGDEVCACYGPHYLHQPSTLKRRIALHQQYFFTCCCSHCIAGEPVSLSPESTQLWNQLIKQIKSTRSLSKLKIIIQKLCSMASDVILFPNNRSIGSILEEAGRDFLEDVNASKEEVEFGFELVARSVQWVKRYFGDSSTEYAWELVKLASILPEENYSNFGFNSDLPRTKSETHSTVFKILKIHYGHSKASEILLNFSDKNWNV